MNAVKRLQTLVAHQGRPTVPEALAPDGDLWATIGSLVRQRGPDTVRISKVKGHATDEDVARGVSTAAHRAGNDGANDAAGKGVLADDPWQHFLLRGVEERRAAMRALAEKVLVAQRDIFAVLVKGSAATPTSEALLRGKARAAARSLHVERSLEQNCHFLKLWGVPVLSFL